MKKKIEKLLADLQKERSTIKQFSIFGDDNWESMDKEIEIYKEILASKNIEKAVSDKMEDLESEIDEVQDKYGDDEYEQMEKERKPFQNVLDNLYPLRRKK